MPPQLHTTVLPQHARHAAQGNPGCNDLDLNGRKILLFIMIINMLGTRRRAILILMIGLKVNEEYYDEHHK